MRWRNGTLAVVLIAVGAVLCAAALAEKGGKQTKAQATETEREVTEAEVPKAALATLRKLAGDAEITEFAEEREDGCIFYEGSWETASGGRMDVLVAHTGALVEIEERMEAGDVPAAVRDLARNSAGRNVPLAFEKKTTILYEVKFEDADGLHELLLTPDGRCVEQEVEKGNTNDEGEEEENGEQLSLRQVPKAVRATILKHAQRKQVEEIERATESGKIVYEAEVIVEGQEIEMKIASDGTLISKVVEDGDEEEQHDD